MTERLRDVPDVPARRYDAIAISAESTVVAEFIPEMGGQAAYQSEAELEKEFIAQLQAQAYEYLTVTTEAQLVLNLRRQLEALNGITFSGAEWERFFVERIAGSNDTAEDKTRRIQEDHVQLLTRDDGSTQNVAVTLRVDSPIEVEYLKNGGILPFVLRELMAA